MLLFSPPATVAPVADACAVDAARTSVALIKGEGARYDGLNGFHMLYGEANYTRIEQVDQGGRLFGQTTP